MKIDGTHYCDHCCVEFKTDENTGRLYCGSVKKTADKFGGFRNAKRFAIRALFGRLLCADCDDAIERKSPAKIPANKKLMAYVRKVEKGDAKPPWTSLSIKKDGKPMCVPIPLTAAGKPK